MVVWSRSGGKEPLNPSSTLASLLLPLWLLYVPSKPPWMAKPLSTSPSLFLSQAQSQPWPKPLPPPLPFTNATTPGSGSQTHMIGLTSEMVGFEWCGAFDRQLFGWFGLWILDDDAIGSIATLPPWEILY